MLIRIVIGWLLAGVAAVSGAPGAVGSEARQPGPPGDREIRVSRDGTVVVTTLTLMLRGPDGPLAINLVLTGRREPSRAGEPTSYEIHFNLPLYVGPRAYERPHYQLSAMVAGTQQILVEGSVDPRLTINEVSVIQAPLEVVQLSQLVGASAASGQVFGVGFALTREQIDAVTTFVDRVVKG